MAARAPRKLLSKTAAHPLTDIEEYQVNRGAIPIYAAIDRLAAPDAIIP
jgi:hypothetical protein